MAIINVSLFIVNGSELSVQEIEIFSRIMILDILEKFNEKVAVLSVQDVYTEQKDMSDLRFL